MTNMEGIAEGYLSECEDQVRTLEWQLSEATKENERLRAVVEAAKREEARHIRDVDAKTEGMPADKREWYRRGHTAGCDLAGVLAFTCQT